MEPHMTTQSLTTYRTLGKTGLKVSPLCLGTMTFGTEWGFGSDAATARQIFVRYVEAGGNFVDTANGYTLGKSEELLGTFLKETGCRDRLVLATKFTMNMRSGDPNAGGNSRKNIRSSLEASLRRLQTEYVDLYWLHAWDTVTPVEEVMQTLDALVREGKVRYIGLSDTPAWYAARAQTLAELRGYERIAALQLEYSLAERNIEREHVPVAQELGMGLCPWSPLAGGLLTGKYKRGADAATAAGDGRLNQPGNAAWVGLDERKWRIAEELAVIAKELNRSPAQVALNWVTSRPGVTSTIIGATKPVQLEDNLTALDFTIPAPLAARLDAIGKPPLTFPYNFFVPERIRSMTLGN